MELASGTHVKVIQPADHMRYEVAYQSPRTISSFISDGQCRIVLGCTILSHQKRCQTCHIDEYRLESDRPSVCQDTPSFILT